jgi:gas vesicle protein
MINACIVDTIIRRHYHIGRCDEIFAGLVSNTSQAGEQKAINGDAPSSVMRAHFMRNIPYVIAFLALGLPTLPIAASDPSGVAPSNVAFLGVSHSPPSAESIVQNNLNAHLGVEVDQVFPGSSAAALGIQPGDIIIQLNGVPIANGADLRQEIMSNREGDPVTAVIRRDGADTELSGNFGGMNGGQQRQRLDLAEDAQYRAEQAKIVQQQEQEKRDEIQQLREELAELAEQLNKEESDARRKATDQSSREDSAASARTQDGEFIHPDSQLIAQGRAWRLRYVINYVQPEPSEQKAASGDL